MITSKKLGENDIYERWQAWQWMRAQPEYADCDGYDNFQTFCSLETQDFAFFNGRMIGLLSLSLRAPGTCEVALITPPAPNVRALLRILTVFQQKFWGKKLFLNTNNPRAMKLAVKMGWHQESPTVAIKSYE